MSTRARSAQLLHRAALLLALICFWISGGAALNHTDEPLAYGVSHSVVGHVLPPQTLSACAACEWEQSFSHAPPPAIHVASLPLVRMHYVGMLPRVLHLRCFDYTALRGPPAPSTLS